jgi:hypothetical protein
MKKQKYYFRLTLLLSISFGVILPLSVGVKDPTLIAIFSSLIWFMYSLVIFVSVFLIKPDLKIKAKRQNGVTVVEYELLNPGKKK